MKTATNKITSFLFLLLGLAPLLFVIFFHVSRIVIRLEMNEKLESSELQTLTIPEKDVVWMDDHEIWVNEHMFDIRTSKLENGVYTFTGLYDEAETELVKTQRETEDKDNEDQSLTRIFKLVLFTVREKPDDVPQQSISLGSYLSFNIHIHHAPFHNVPTPPPRGAYYIHA